MSELKLLEIMSQNCIQSEYIFYHLLYPSHFWISLYIWCWWICYSWKFGTLGNFFM